MGCSIHMITEIKRNGKWEPVNEVPGSFTERNYSTFAFLADVRNDFDTEGFEPKGLPEDISGKRFYFESETDDLKEAYANDSITKVKLPDGTYISENDRILERLVSKEEAKEVGSWGCSNGQYYIWDPELVNGVVVDLLYKDLMTEDEYLKDHGRYDENANDYGYWKIDFECSDYHSHSYITLKELNEKDLTSYKSCKCKLSKAFYDKFVELGGIFPEGMQVLVERVPSDMIEAIRFAFDPTVIASWMPSDEIANEYPVLKGIRELRKIAIQHQIENEEDIRIVFVFDN